MTLFDVVFLMVWTVFACVSVLLVLQIVFALERWLDRAARRRDRGWS